MDNNGFDFYKENHRVPGYYDEENKRYVWDDTDPNLPEWWYSSSSDDDDF